MSNISHLVSQLLNEPRDGIALGTIVWGDRHVVLIWAIGCEMEWTIEFWVPRNQDLEFKILLQCGSRIRSDANQYQENYHILYMGLYLH